RGSVMRCRCWPWRQVCNLPMRDRQVTNLPPRPAGSGAGPGVEGGVAAGLLDPAAQVLQRLLQHLVRQRLAVLLPLRLLGPHHVAVVAPAPEVAPLLERQRHLQASVGLDAPLVGLLALGEAVDVLAGGPPVARRRQLQGALVALHRDDVLHAALAVTALAHDDGPLVVLEGGRDDLAGA